MLKHAYDLRLPRPFWQWNTARPTPLAHCFRFPSAPSAPLLAPPRPEVEMAEFIRIPWKLVSICQHMGHSITMWHAQTGYPNDMCSVNLFHLLQKTRWFFPHRPCSRQELASWKQTAFSLRASRNWVVSVCFSSCPDLKQRSEVGQYYEHVPSFLFVYTKTLCKAEITLLVCVCACVRAPQIMNHRWRVVSTLQCYRIESDDIHKPAIHMLICNHNERMDSRHPELCGISCCSKHQNDCIASRVLFYAQLFLDLSHLILTTPHQIWGQHRLVWAGSWPWFNMYVSNSSMNTVDIHKQKWKVVRLFQGSYH